MLKKKIHLQICGCRQEGYQRGFKFIIQDIFTPLNLNKEAGVLYMFCYNPAFAACIFCSHVKMLWFLHIIRFLLFYYFFFYVSNIFLHLMYFIDTQSTTIKDHLIFNFSSELLTATLLHRLRPVSLTTFISREPYLWVIIGRTLEGLTAVHNRRAESDFCRPNPFSG